MEDYRKLSDLMCDSSTDVVLEYIRTKNINPETFADHELPERGREFDRCSSPLGLAIKYGHLLVMNKLISLGFDPNIPCKIDYEPSHKLHLACKYKTRSPLHLACKYNRLDIILSLHHDHGIDIDSVDDSGVTALVYAVSNTSEKTLDVVKTLVEAGASVNSSCCFVRTPLSMAVARQNIDVCRYLISKGADVNARNNDARGRTCLMLALECRADIGMLRLLVESGADVNASDYESKSPLMYAMDTYVKIDVVQFLLASGADVDYSDKYKKSSLVYAINNCAGIDIIHVLLDYGADVNALDEENKSPLCYALGTTDSSRSARMKMVEETIKMLIKYGADVNVLDNKQLSPLMYVLRTKLNANIEVIKMLVKSGANVNVLNKNQVSPIMQAVLGRANLDVIRVLVESGANVNVLNKNQVSPLMKAVRVCADTDVIRVLVESGANVNVVDKKKKSALYHVMESNRHVNDKEAILKVLIQAGADVNMMDTNMISPLILSVRKDVDICLTRLLVTSGADVNEVDSERKSSLMHAIENTAGIDVIEFLVESGAAINVVDADNKSTVRYAIEPNRLDQIDLLKLLVKSGADVNVLDNTLVSPLMYAISKCHGYELFVLTSAPYVKGKFGDHTVNIVACLIECGADVNALDINNVSPLMYSLRCRPNRLVDVLRLLLEAGANVNVVDNKGHKSLLHYAAENTCNGYCSESIDVVQLLVDSGADVNIPDNYGDTPLMYALDAKAYVELILLLLKCGADVCARNQDNISPLSIIFRRCLHYKHKTTHDGEVINLVQIFEEHASDVKGHFNTLPRTREVHTAFDVIRTLCTKGADIGAKDASGNSVLHQVFKRIAWCCCAKCFNLLHYLIVELNLSLSALNNANETPFHCAQMKTDFRWEEAGKILKLCVQAGYTPDTEVMSLIRLFEEELSTDIKGSDVTSLQDLCCFSVRRALGRRLPTAVNSLPIPEPVKQYVKLTHVETMVETPGNTTEYVEYHDADVDSDYDDASDTDSNYYANLSCQYSDNYLCTDDDDDDDDDDGDDDDDDDDGDDDDGGDDDGGGGDDDDDDGDDDDGDDDD